MFPEKFEAARKRLKPSSDVQRVSFSMKAGRCVAMRKLWFVFYFGCSNAKRMLIESVALSNELNTLILTLQSLFVSHGEHSVKYQQASVALRRALFSSVIRPGISDLAEGTTTDRIIAGVLVIHFLRTFERLYMESRSADPPVTVELPLEQFRDAEMGNSEGKPCHLTELFQFHPCAQQTSEDTKVSERRYLWVALAHCREIDSEYEGVSMDERSFSTTACALQKSITQMANFSWGE